MQVKDLMSHPVIRISPDESVAVAARTLEHYNIGVLPVCRENGRLCGLVTDRDLVTRCIATGKNPEDILVQDVMTRQIVTVDAHSDVKAAAALMGARQIRRLPVVNGGAVCGLISLGDLAQKTTERIEAGKALAGIVSNVVKGQ